MTHDNSPRDVALPTAAKRDLAAVQNSTLGFDVDEQLARFQARLKANDAAAKPHLPLWKRSAVRRALLLAACLGLASVALSAYLPKHGQPATPRSTQPSPAVARGAENRTEKSADPDVSGQTAPQAETEALPTASRSHVAASGSTSSAAQLREETEQLARIRTLFEREPARALRLCDEADRRFARGVFGVEREAIRIVALQALGQREQAITRAKAYLTRYPRGPLAQNIRGIAQAD